MTKTENAPGRKEIKKSSSPTHAGNYRSRAWKAQGISLLCTPRFSVLAACYFSKPWNTVWKWESAGVPAAPGELSAEVEIEEVPVEKEVVKVEPEPIPEPEMTDDGEEFVPKPEIPPVVPPKQVAVAPVVKAKPAPPVKVAKPSGGGGTGAQDSSGAGGAQVSAKPNYLKNPPPPYPSEARQKKQEGLVILRAQVNAKGTVDGVELKQSSGFALLDESALKAVKNWKFLPATLGGIKMASSVVVPVRFRLDN